MKYKVIKLEDNKSVLVDESAEIKGLYHDSFTNKLYQSNGAEYVKSNQVNNVIATINHSISLDVPMVIVEDGVEKLALIEYPEYWVEDNGCNYIHQEYDDNKGARLIWIKAYKAAQQKGVYSEEDLRKAFIAGDCYGKQVSTKGNIEDYIQSLNQEYIELETEEIYSVDNRTLSFLDLKASLALQTTFFPKIKTDRADGQLIAFEKKQ